MAGLVYVQHPLGTLVPVHGDAPPSVWSMYQSRVRQQPDQPAFGDPFTAVSYRGSYHGAMALAAYLEQKLSVAPGDRVALFMRNRTEYGLMVLACLAQKAVIVPLNTRLAPPEIAELLLNAGVHLVIADQALLAVITEAAEAAAEGGVNEQSWRVVAVEALLDAAGLSPLESLQQAGTGLAGDRSSDAPADREPASPWDPAVILYTSGTTGTPKGAVVTHTNLVNNVLNFQNAFGTGPGTRTLMPVPFYHVTGLLALFLHTICVGGFVRLLPEYSTQTFLDWMEGDRITYTCVVPAIYTLAVNHPTFGRRDLSHWRVAAYGGSPMPVEIIRKLVGQLPAIRAINTYGATEVTGSCTFLPPEEALLKPESVGLPTAVHRVKVVDEEGKDLPPGVVGEIAITGATLTAGYWNNPTATQREFRDGWWFSGDLGWIDEGGYVYVVGRRRETINRGGEKIYPLEVEEALYNFPAVLEAAVVGVSHPIFGQEAAAALVPRPGHSIDFDELRAFLAKRLADYKIPGRFVLVDALPRNPAGKVLKHEVARLLETGGGS